MIFQMIFHHHHPYPVALVVLVASVAVVALVAASLSCPIPLASATAVSSATNATGSPRLLGLAMSGRAQLLLGKIERIGITFNDGGYLGSSFDFAERVGAGARFEQAVNADLSPHRDGNPCRL
jgi:hypothetical protein